MLFDFSNPTDVFLALAIAGVGVFVLFNFKGVRSLKDEVYKHYAPRPEVSRVADDLRHEMKDMRNDITHIVNEQTRMFIESIKSVEDRQRENHDQLTTLIENISPKSQERG